MSTIAVTRRETNGWKWPLFMLAYLFGLAYLFAGMTYWTAVGLGWAEDKFARGARRSKELMLEAKLFQNLFK